MENLVNCQLLPYIISLLDNPQQVLRCMRVCHGLYQTIKANFHFLAKYKVDLSIYNHLRSMRDPVVYSITCFSAKDDQDLLSREMLFKYKFYAHKTTLESRTKEGKASHYTMPSSGALESFEEILQRQLFKFEYGTFRVDEQNERVGSTGMSTAVVDYVKAKAITSDSCFLNTAPGFELLQLLECKTNIMIQLIGDEYDSLPLIAKCSDRMDMECDIGPEPSLLPIRQLMKDWELGNIDIVHLTIRYNKHGPRFDKLFALLQELHVPRVHGIEMENIRAVLNRSDSNSKKHLYVDTTRNSCGFTLTLTCKKSDKG